VILPRFLCKNENAIVVKGMGELENQGVIVLELAVCQATQYKFAIFFKNENPSETTLGVLILLWVLLYSKKSRLHVKAHHARTAGETWHSNLSPIFVTSDLRMPIC